MPARTTLRYYYIAHLRIRFHPWSRSVNVVCLQKTVLNSCSHVLLGSHFSGTQNFHISAFPRFQKSALLTTHASELSGLAGDCELPVHPQYVANALLSFAGPVCCAFEMDVFGIWQSYASVRSYFSSLTSLQYNTSAQQGCRIWIRFEFRLPPLSFVRSFFQSRNSNTAHMPNLICDAPNNFMCLKLSVILQWQKFLYDQDSWWMTLRVVIACYMC